MIASILDRILSLPGWLALLVVFAVPALEASAFVGFFFPGEVAVVLGGVLASQHRISLPAAIAAAVLGAVVGDTVGYLVGRRWGRAILGGTLGRLPFIKRHLEKSLDRARAYLHRRKGRAIFFGRFTAALRVLIPGLAGMSGIPFPVFLLYNVVGGVLWATGFVLLGFGAGAGYRRVEGAAGAVGLALLTIVVVGLVLSFVARQRRHHPERIRAWGDRLAATTPLAWVRRRFPRSVPWLRRRLDASGPTGLPLTLAVLAAASSSWLFAGVTQDVVSNEEAVRLDPGVERFVLAHRVGWLTAGMKAVTWLGSAAVLIPLVLAVGGLFLVRRRRWRPGVTLAVALGGSIALSDLVAALVARPRPPLSFEISSYSGWAFPSGHATQAVAAYAMLAIVLSAGRSLRVRWSLFATALAIAVVVGASRIYLGAHWFTDVLGGEALGAAWVCVVLALSLLAARRTEEVVSGGRRVGPPRRHWRGMLAFHRPSWVPTGGRAFNVISGSARRRAHWSAGQPPT